MINKFIWEIPKGEIKYKEKDFMIIYKKGFETISCPFV